MSEFKTRVSNAAIPHNAKEPKDIFEVGEMLSHTYEIRGLLGAGGMGQVFNAYDHRLERHVAIKGAWPFVEHDSLTAEAKALANLQHAGLVTVHAMGIHEGVNYLVMERLHGLPLSEHIDMRGDASPFTADEAIDILIGIADALAAVHRAGIIHRDLKPDNIMLTPGHRVVLLDFGIRQTNEEAAAETEVYGSPLYLAPEVVKSCVQAPEAHLVDLYALGCIAFELLTGRPPFEASSVMKILMRHVSDPAPRAGDARPDLPLHLDRLVNEMLAKTPADRPCSIDVVAAWLRAIRRDRTGSSHETHLNVLIVDDDSDMRGLLEACVDHAVPGAQVRTAHDGTKALELFRQKPPEVMLLDLQMPGMSGVEMCMHLRATTLAAQTTIVAVSAHASDEDLSLLRKLGVVNFVSKKTSPDELISDLVDLVRSIYSTRDRILRG
jgi:serine/threonine-protein kinase